MPLDPERASAVSLDAMAESRRPILIDALADRVAAVVGEFSDWVSITQLDHLNRREKDVMAKDYRTGKKYVKHPRDVVRPIQWDDFLHQLSEEDPDAANAVLSVLGQARRAGLQTVGDLREASRYTVHDGLIFVNRYLSGLPAAFCLRAFVPTE